MRISCFARLLTAGVVAMVLAAAPLSAHAQQTPSAQPLTSKGLPDFLGPWLDKLFGKKDEGPRPEETLQAPFADPAQIARENAADRALEQRGVIYTSTDGNKYRVVTGEDGAQYEIPVYAPDDVDATESSLALAHRRPEQIADWLVRATSEIFTMDSANYQGHLERLSTGMSEGGLGDFTRFMEESNILNELQTQGMRLQGFVEDPPLLLNEGALNGRYRWLFEMPITVTFLSRTARTYQRSDNLQENTLRFTVQTQLGRVEKGPSEENVVIETWRVRARPGAPPARR